MKSLKIMTALFLFIAIGTFVLAQGFYWKNISILHTFLGTSLGIVEEMHVAESFHSSMHSMIIHASAYLHSGEDRYKEEFNKKLNEGEKAVSRLVSMRHPNNDNEHSAHTAPVAGDEIASNIETHFLELKKALAPVMSREAGSGNDNIVRANRIFDEVFHKYYVRIHTSHYSSLENLQDEAHKIYKTSNYIYTIQLVLSILVGIVLAFFADRVFLKIYKITEQHSLTDSLTTIHNRRFLDTVAADEIERAVAKGASYSIVIIDIDDFKKFNDSFGHLAGDKLLKDFAILLRSLLRETDKLIRYGGEEFLVILPSTSQKQAVVVSEKLCCAIRDNNFSLPDGSFSRHVTASFGVATMPENGKGFSTALKAADGSLYRSKREGKNRVTASS